MQYLVSFRVLEKLEGDDKALFKKNMAVFVKEVLGEFDEYQFFMGKFLIFYGVGSKAPKQLSYYGMITINYLIMV